MQCEKCKTGEMAATSVRKLSSGLVAIGYILLAIGLLGLATAGCVAVVGTSSSARVSEQSKKDSNEWAIEKLEEAEAPAELIAKLRRSGRLDETSIDLAVPDEAKRQRVKSIAAVHASMVGGSELGTGIAAGIGTAFVLLVGVTSLPMLIIGLLLTLKKNVWRCGGCGYVFDRA